MTHDEGQVLPAANTALQVENMKLKRLVVELQGQVETLSKQLAELEKRQKTPSFVNANRLKKKGVQDTQEASRPAQPGATAGRANAGRDTFCYREQLLSAGPYPSCESGL